MMMIRPHCRQWPLTWNITQGLTGGANFKFNLRPSPACDPLVPMYSGTRPGRGPPT
jgi:hypothetical protein